MFEDEEVFQIKDYYKEVDYSLWDDIFLVCKEKLENGSDDIKKQWSLELYSKYLQIIEILSINILVVGTNNIGNLFISNGDLREDIVRFAKDKAIVEEFIDKAIFHIQQKSIIENYKKARSLYVRILNESLDDYTKDFDLLNAYKHGFRIEAKGMSSVSLEGSLVANYNSTLTYYSNKKDKEARQQIIFKNTRAFNCESILYRSHFMIDILKKLKASSSNIVGEKVVLETLCILDEEHFKKSYGSFRWKEPFLVSEIPEKRKSKIDYL